MNLINCYRCYYFMGVMPQSPGKALVFDCCANMFRPWNRLVVKQGLRQAWNSREFRFQRSRVSRSDWSFCRGASCQQYHFISESLFTEEPSVKRAMEKKEPALDYGPRVLFLIPSFSCNNACSFCCFSARRKSKESLELSPAVCREIKDELIPEAGWVIVSGGEPFLSPRGTDFIEQASESRDKRCIVMTNAALLHKFGLEKIVNRNIMLKVSLYALSAPAYRRICRSDNFDAAFGNINALLERGYRGLELNFVLSRDSLGELEGFCGFIKDNPSLRAVVYVDFFRTRECCGTALAVQRNFSSISDRLKFVFHEEGLAKRLFRRLYDPYLSLQYHFARI